MVLKSEIALTEAGYAARDYPNNRIKPGVRLFEGGLIFDGAGFDYTGRTSSNWKVEQPMHIGQFVVFHPDSTPHNLLVKPAPTANEAHGRLIIHPTLESGMGWTDEEINMLPREDKDWGEFVPRGGTVEIFGETIEDLKLPAQNEEIKVGDYLDCDNSNEEFTVSETPTNWIAIAKVPELKGGFVPAIALK